MSRQALTVQNTFFGPDSRYYHEPFTSIPRDFTPVLPAVITIHTHGDLPSVGQAEPSGIGIDSSTEPENVSTRKPRLNPIHRVNKKNNTRKFRRSEDCPDVSTKYSADTILEQHPDKLQGENLLKVGLHYSNREIHNRVRRRDAYNPDPPVGMDVSTIAHRLRRALQHRANRERDTYHHVNIAYRAEVNKTSGRPVCNRQRNPKLENTQRTGVPHCGRQLPLPAQHQSINQAHIDSKTTSQSTLSHQIPLTEPARYNYPNHHRPPQLIQPPAMLSTTFPRPFEYVLESMTSGSNLMQESSSQSTESAPSLNEDAESLMTSCRYVDHSDEHKPFFGSYGYGSIAVQEGNPLAGARTVNEPVLGLDDFPDPYGVGLQHSDLFINQWF